MSRVFLAIKLLFFIVVRLYHATSPGLLDSFIVDAYRKIDVLDMDSIASKVVAIMER